MQTLKQCSNCGFRTLNPQQCPVIGYDYADPASSCPHHVYELVHCSFCDAIIPKPHYTLIHSVDNSWKPICDNCFKLSGHCGGCSKSTTCDFETNPSTIPKAVQKTFQQGPQTITTMVKNPTRIDITCRVNCQCFSEEFGCLRENNTCGKYESRF